VCSCLIGTYAVVSIFPSQLWTWWCHDDQAHCCKEIFPNLATVGNVQGRVHSLKVISSVNASSRVCSDTWQWLVIFRCDNVLNSALFSWQLTDSL